MIKEIYNLIKYQFEELMFNDSDFYKESRIILANEQDFVKNVEKKRGNIYIVLKFMPATINFGQNTLPVTFNAISEKNGLEICQKLLCDYAQVYNLHSTDVQSLDDTSITYNVQQVYTTPSVMSNFNDVNDGFRTLFYMTSTFLISKNSNPFSLYYFENEDDEEGIYIEGFSNAFNFDNTMDSQPYFTPQNPNFIESISKFGSLAINITTFLVDNDFINKVLGIICKTYDTDTPFYIKISFKNGLTTPLLKLKLANVSGTSVVGELNTISLTFSN